MGLKITNLKKDIITIRKEEVARLQSAYANFTAFGYRNQIATRPCNDVYDVVGNEHYYVASDRDLLSGTGPRELVLYNRRAPVKRLQALDIATDCGIDLYPDGSKVPSGDIWWCVASHRHKSRCSATLMVLSPGTM